MHTDVGAAPGKNAALKLIIERIREPALESSRRVAWLQLNLGEYGLFVLKRVVYGTGI
jgi:hypothetical protein